MTTANVATVGNEVLPGMTLPQGREYRLAVLRDRDTRGLMTINGTSPTGLMSAQSSALRNNGVIFLGLRSLGTVANFTGYMDYDGELSLVPVNQIPLGREWKKALGTFAHHIASFSDRWHMMREPGFYKNAHSFVHTDESNIRNRVTVWWGLGVCGEAYRLVDAWMALDPVIDPTLHADLNWKVGQATLEAMMADICANCQGTNILRRFNRKVEALNYQTALNSGLVVLPNFDEESWGPREVLRRFTHLGTSARNDIWDELALWCDKALEYYDENIAPTVSESY